MKAVAICGSSHAGGSTETLLKALLERLKQKGMSTQLVGLGFKQIFPCSGCGTCLITRNAECVLDDDFAVLFRAICEADILVIGSPGDRGAAAPELKSLLERVGRVVAARDNMLSRKIGGAVVVLGEKPSTHVTARLLTWFLAQEMVVPGAPYGRGASGAQAVSVRADEAGEAVMERFADNLAWLAEKLADPDSISQRGRK